MKNRKQDFEELNAIGKGAENYLIDFYQRKGRIIYRPTTPGAHNIDMFTLNPINNKFVGVEVKKQNIFYGYKTGIDCFTFTLEHWNKYQQFDADTGLELWIAVVDWGNEKEPGTNIVYSGLFTTLNKTRFLKESDGNYWQYPKVSHSTPGQNCRRVKVRVPVEAFDRRTEITDEEIKRFKQ